MYRAIYSDTRPLPSVATETLPYFIIGRFRNFRDPEQKNGCLEHFSIYPSAL